MAIEQYRLEAWSSKQDELERVHRLYCDYNQEETDICKLLIELGHPNSDEYHELRDFFDSLLYCCNSGARYYSYESEEENTEYWGPELHVRNTGVYHPCDGEVYINVLKLLKISELDPYWLAGSWIVCTKDEEFFNEIEKIEEIANIHLSYKDVPRGHERASWMRPHNAYDHFSVTIYLENKEQFERVKCVIDQSKHPLRNKN